MNGLELYILGRRLMKIGQEATPQAGIHRLPTSVQLVLMDISEHPDSSISDIVERTGFPQSLVSTAVARMRDGGALETNTDAADRRRTLVRVSPKVRARMAQVPTTPLEDVLGPALGINDPAEVADLLSALESLARRFDKDVGQASEETTGTKPVPEGK